MIRPHTLLTLLLTMLPLPALALENVVPTPPTIETCERVILPTHVYTMAADLDVERFAQETLEQDQVIRSTRSVYGWEEPIAFTIFVDLFHDHHGGLIEIDISDQYGNPTWNTIQPVPPLMTNVGLLRNVIPISIPLFQLESAFPRTSVYVIRASAYPIRGENSQCAFSASTSVIVDPSYPAMYP